MLVKNPVRNERKPLVFGHYICTFSYADILSGEAFYAASICTEKILKIDEFLLKINRPVRIFVICIYMSDFTIRQPD